jgi:hypothetical protein
MNNVSSVILPIIVFGLWVYMDDVPECGMVRNSIFHVFIAIMPILPGLNRWYQRSLLLSLPDRFKFIKLYSNEK